MISKSQHISSVISQDSAVKQANGFMKFLTNMLLTVTVGVKNYRSWVVFNEKDMTRIIELAVNLKFRAAAFVEFTRILLV